MMKKGSLNLSIEAIVIVVIAFVVLGLGLGFVRGQFKSITETTTSIQDQIRQQITEDLRTGDKKLSFPTNEFTINKKMVRELCDFLIQNPQNIRWTCQTRADLVDEDLLHQMKRAGCALIHYGVESGAQRILDPVDKNLKL